MTAGYPLKSGRVENDPDKLSSLKRMQRLATSLLIAMIGLFLAAGLGEKAYPWMGFIRAFAEAAIVGALADWFAVTALFRYPFGLRLPHTAVIPTNKDRIGESLGNFVEKNFLTPEAVREKISSMDIAGKSAGWLADPANSRLVAEEIASFIPRALEVLEDKDIRGFIRRGAVSGIRSLNLAHVLGQFLTLLTSENRHQALFDETLVFIRNLFDRLRPDLQSRITEESSILFLLLNGDTRLYNRIVAVVQDTLDQIAGNPDHELRRKFSAAMEDFIRNLKESPEYLAKVEEMKEEILRNPLVEEYLEKIWTDIKKVTIDDIEAPGSVVKKKLDGVLRSVYGDLLSDETIRRKINEWALAAIMRTVTRHRSEISNLIAEKVKKWDAETMTRKLELEVGKDLQYIRINGTVIGGCIGLLIHGASLLLH